MSQKTLLHRIKDDGCLPWRENGLKKRTKVMDTIAPPCKNGKSPGSERRFRSRKRQYPLPLDRVEELRIRRVLASARSLQDAAEILGIDQATLRRRRKQYGL